MASTTLTRFLNNPTHANALSARTIAAVERVTGIRFGAGGAPPSGFGEPEADAFDASRASAELAERIEALTASKNSLTVWRLRSHAIEAIGYLPGDILIVDLNEPPKRGDVVCAQLYDWSRMKAETVFRLFEPPYLLAAAFDRSQLSARLIDKEVGIKGPVIFSVRPRAA
ncbi:MAG TPA: hypothetical protein VKU03_12445 [Roseiarcus sp.]|nr:hypothetical protein [Roseiarcus sp.]